MECAVRNHYTDSEAIDKTGILVVDDDWDSRRMLALCLAMEGFKATCAASGDEALILLKSSPFCLMLTDYNMPGMDGLRLSEEALKAHPGLVIVMMTGASLKQLYLRAARSGISAVLAKPLNIKELFSIIRLENKRRITLLGPAGLQP
ncbi:MAG TPA: response regulator [Desulfuromonadaceae bacterium]|jgi:CheY-like chemotaxis protein